MQYERLLSTFDEIKTFSDPFRLKILLSFRDADEPLTVKQIAVMLEEVPSKIHYHVKELERIGVLEIVETREKSGILEKYYLPTATTFRIDKNIRTSKGNPEHLVDIGNTIIDALIGEYNEFNKLRQKSTNESDIMMSTIYLTDEEYEELISIIENYVITKRNREGTKPYTYGHFLFRKYDNSGGDK